MKIYLLLFKAAALLLEMGFITEIDKTLADQGLFSLESYMKKGGDGRTIN